MKGRSIIAGVVLVAALVGASATVLALSTPSRNVRKSVLKGIECSLSQLRVTGVFGVLEGSEGGAEHKAVRFVNEGRSCVIDSRSHLTLTSRANTGAILREGLWGMLRVGPRQTATVTMGVGWNDFVGNIGPTGPDTRRSCPWVEFDLVVFHSRGKSTAVSFGRHPISACKDFTPFDMYLTRK